MPKVRVVELRICRAVVVLGFEVKGFGALDSSSTASRATVVGDSVRGSCAVTTAQDHGGAVRERLLQFATTIPPEELFPTLAEGAAELVAEDPFAFILVSGGDKLCYELDNLRNGSGRPNSFIYENVPKFSQKFGG